VIVTPDELWNAFESCVAAVEEPLGTPSILPMWHLTRRAREDVTVVLTGQGCDEPWGGYRRYQAEIWRRRLPLPHLLGLLEPLLRHLPSVPELLERAVASIPVADRVQRLRRSIRRSLPICASSSPVRASRAVPPDRFATGSTGSAGATCPTCRP